MSDFDFEELDKAVSGALGSDTTSSVPEPAPEPPKETPPQVRPVEPTPPREQRGSAPAARRSAGRFMDVVHPSSDMRTKSSAFTPPVSSPSVPTPEVTPSIEEDTPWNQPLESPFLPDTKVEKRPLGAFSLDTSASSTDEPEELLLEAPDEPRIEAHTMPDPIDFAAQDAALTSESEDTGAAEQPADEPVVEEASEELKTLDVQPSSIPEEEPAPVHAVTTPEVVEPAGPASITQQYTEQPSSAPSSGAIYDTENYHAPLAPPPKKRSGVWVALWIFLLIILGAGAGVAFYLFVLPML